jgi:trans-aconitate 2-methyltransferase
MSWQPTQYERFKAERAQPFRDLAALIRLPAPARVLDLGCGTGALTRELHDSLQARETLGIDNSAEMLESSKAFEAAALHFERRDIETFATERPFDLVFSNAALHWLPDHPALFRRLRGLLAPGGQLAVQMPSNESHLSHRTAAEVASEEPFRSELSGHVRQSSVLPPEAYAELLYSLGFREQHVELRIYGHELAGGSEVVEWVKGSLLTDYASRLSSDLYRRFVERYRQRLLELIGHEGPYFYTYRRILLWGRLPDVAGLTPPPGSYASPPSR